MADLKISQFTDGGAIQTGDEIATNRSGVNTKVFVGSSAALDAGVGVGDVVILGDDGSGNAQLPAVDGTLLTGIASLSGNNTWTGTQTFIDNLFEIIDNGDATKKIVFELSDISSGQTRIITFPNLNATLATTSSLTQTFVGQTNFSNSTNSFGTNAGTSTTNLGSGATTSGNTKTVNIGTGGLAGSTTDINIGSANGTVTTNQRGGVVAGNATGGNKGDGTYNAKGYFLDNIAHGLGYAQTWQSLIASRAVDGIYQNITGKPIAVAVGITHGATGTQTVFEVGLSSPPTTLLGSFVGSTNANWNIYAIVPSGYYYRLRRVAGTVTIPSYWQELTT